MPDGRPRRNRWPGHPLAVNGHGPGRPLHLGRPPPSPWRPALAPDCVVHHADGCGEHEPSARSPSHQHDRVPGTDLRLALRFRGEWDGSRPTVLAGPRLLGLVQHARRRPGGTGDDGPGACGLVRLPVGRAGVAHRASPPGDPRGLAHRLVRADVRGQPLWPAPAARLARDHEVAGRGAPHPGTCPPRPPGSRGMVSPALRPYLRRDAGERSALAAPRHLAAAGLLALPGPHAGAALPALRHHRRAGTDRDASAHPPGRLAGTAGSRPVPVPSSGYGVGTADRLQAGASPGGRDPPGRGASGSRRPGAHPGPGLGQAEREHPEGTRIFNEFLYGGFLIYFTPGLKVFIDDRCELYGDDWLMQFSEAMRSHPERIDRWQETYGFPYALVARGTAFDRYLGQSRRWSVMKRTGTATLYEISAREKRPEEHTATRKRGGAGG